MPMASMTLKIRCHTRFRREAMIVLTFCLRRIARMTQPEFQHYWLHTHGPLVSRLLPALGAMRYEQLHASDDPVTKVLTKMRAFSG